MPYGIAAFPRKTQSSTLEFVPVLPQTWTMPPPITFEVDETSNVRPRSTGLLAP